MQRHPDFPQPIYNGIAFYRKKKDISQYKLAQKIGISRQALSKIEHGKVIPTLLVALRIAEYFQQPVEEIFSLREPIPDKWRQWTREQEDEWLKQLLIDIKEGRK